MDEEFIFQVTEEELAQFPEEGDLSQGEQSPLEPKQGLEIEDKEIQESTEKQDKENNKVKIPSLLDLKLPRLYAASRNGRWNKGTSAEKKREEEAAGEGDANPAPNPEVVLPNNQDGDNPLVIPDREEDETRDDYAVRVMQAVSQHQINSFNQMIQSMRDISKEVKKKKKPEWEETDEDEDEDNSNYQDAPERPKIHIIRKRIQAPISRE